MRQSEVGEASPADWRVAATDTLEYDTREVELEAHELECASGKSAEGRIVAEVTYGEREILVDVRVGRLAGDVECPSNPITRFVLALSQPLRDRAIVVRDGQEMKLDVDLDVDPVFATGAVMLLAPRRWGAGRASHSHLAGITCPNRTPDRNPSRSAPEVRGWVTYVSFYGGMYAC